VNPDPVAGVQQRRRVPAAHDCRDAEFARDDRRVRQRGADVGGHRRCAGEQRRPADVRHGRHQDLASLEFGPRFGREDHPHTPLDDPGRTRKTLDGIPRGRAAATRIEQIAAPPQVRGPQKRVEAPANHRRIRRQRRVTLERGATRRDKRERSLLAAEDTEDFIH
jgi:hypothetical protein